MKSRKRNSTTGAFILPGALLLLASLLLLFPWLGNLKSRKRMTTICPDGYDLYDLLTAAGFSDKVARFVVSQAAHESANFSSPVYKENSNPFGIKYFGQKEAEAVKNGIPVKIEEYAYYLNRGQAVQDYKRVIKTYGTLIYFTLEDFVKTLQRRKYFEATYDEYLKGCKWFYNLYFPEGWEKKKVHGAGGSW